MAKLIDETGNVYGYLTVLERGPNNGTRATWVCKCKCGNIVTVIGKNLRNGTTKSCGCYIRELTIQRNMDRGGGDLTGHRFGKLVVLGFDSWLEHSNGHRDRMWKCQCDCGNICIVNHRYLRFGDTESCGCNKSRGNAAVMKWLTDHNIQYKSEYGFKDFVSPRGTQYKYDFALFNADNSLNCLIEYQGNIHFEVGSGWNTSEALADCQRRDSLKLNYCIKNNLKLYYITYKDNIENEMEKIINERFN